MTTNHVVLGTGAIGRAVMEELIKRGESVRMLNRSGKMDEVPAEAEVVASDLYDQAKVKEVTRGAQVVYQAAQPNYNEWPQKFPLLQKSIIDGLAGSGAKLVLVENLYMYGETNGKLLTEDTPYHTHTRKGRVRGEISTAASNAHQDGRVRVTAARGGNFFGPWGTDSSMGARAFYPLLHGKPAQLIGRTDLPHSHTYVKDFGKALVILGERSEADGQAWHVPNDMPQITQGELVRMFAEEAGVEPKMSSMGKLMMWIGGLFIPEAKESVEMMYEFNQPFIVDSSKFEKAFGMKATPMREAIRETVAWYKSHPEKH
ncbi:MAG: NAD-dependent epimerase/dehydratase family protein [Anaerolineae bacterium]|nr:NAD-dependent epimerase/dehydratase family protein [Anaerolineae bacterium]MCI0607785.1 NAD-dependent epimerase/dehydratase family protein [Anaerolineae bacterium]